MSQSQHLSGKVTKRVLPAFEGAVAVDAPNLKRLLLPQGELAQLHNDDEPIHYLAFIELRKGTVRGNHIHKIKKEFVYIMAGETELIVEDADSKARETIPMRAGELAVISPGVAHAFRVLKSGQAVEFSPSQYDPADTCRHPLV